MSEHKVTIFPPALLKIKIDLMIIWFPLFLFWPFYFFLLSLAYLAACFYVLFTFRLVSFRVVTLIHIILCNLRGLNFEVSKGDKPVDIQLF